MGSLDYLLRPIGVVRSPVTERAHAPRQPGAQGAEGRVELEAARGFEDALEGLEAWEYLWIVFVFHRNVEQARGWKPKVRPPRSERKLGVFATRSPHRPNPIGLSAVRLDRVEGLVVHVRGLDLLDGTPVLDLKPYVPYADAHPEAGSGWLEPSDPRATWEVALAPEAAAELEWLAVRGVPLRERVEATLALGPQPHAYRRIRAHGSGLRLAVEAWRVDFVVDAHRITVERVRSGYRASQLAGDLEGVEVHRRFVEAFGS